MIEVYKGVYQGSDEDVVPFRRQFPEGYIIHAAKEPWHREALGYEGKSAPMDDPEYLVARRDRDVYLNMVDAHSADYIPEELVAFTVGETVVFRTLTALPVLIHCNHGRSRSVLLCLLLEPWLGPQLAPLRPNNMGRGCAEFYRKHIDYYIELAKRGERP